MYKLFPFTVMTQTLITFSWTIAILLIESETIA